MKKLFAFIVLGGLFLSCTYSDSDKVVNSKLLTTLEVYNAQVLIKHPQTKGFGSICAVVSADFLAGYEGGSKGATLGFKIGMMCGGKGLEGAILGGGIMGLVCGVGGSYAA